MPPFRLSVAAGSSGWKREIPITWENGSFIIGRHEFYISRVSQNKFSADILDVAAEGS